MDIIGRLHYLQKQRGWTFYEIAKRSGMSSTSVMQIFKRQNPPTLPVLEDLCHGFEIPISRLLSDDFDEFFELTKEEIELIEKWVALSPEVKTAIYQAIEYEERIKK